MSTEILSTPPMELVVLRDVIPMAQGLGTAAMSAGSVRITMGGEEDNQLRGEQPIELDGSVRITMSSEGDDGPTADEIEEMERSKKREGKQLIDTQITLRDEGYNPENYNLRKKDPKQKSVLSGVRMGTQEGTDLEDEPYPPEPVKR